MIYYSDLDDTITDNKCLFYSKVKFFSKFKDFEKNKQKYYKKIFNDFKINKNFLKLINKKSIKEIFILSRNKDDFVKFFVKEFNNQYSKKYSLKVVGGIGDISSLDKIQYINGNGYLISDIFECNILKKYKNFICIDKYNIFIKFNRYFIKTLYLLFYILQEAISQ